MNEQKAPNGIEWCRVYGRRGYTWNVIGGCLHNCRWLMPDGKEAGCYAKDTAEGVARAAYPQGFEHHYFHPERLDEPLKLQEPAGIFLDSMSDLMGHWVPEEQIHQVLSVCGRASQHIFFLLTKNAPRLQQFNFPPNVWVGVSSPPDYMMGKVLHDAQRERMLTLSLDVLSTLYHVKVRWMSFEPLSWHVASIVAQYPDALQWAVIGAASSGTREYAPDAENFKALRTVLDKRGVPLFYKGNLHSLAEAHNHWREDFPGAESRLPPAQLKMF